jgi:hypothetical protein
MTVRDSEYVAEGLAYRQRSRLLIAGLDVVAGGSLDLPLLGLPPARPFLVRVRDAAALQSEN